MRNKFLRFRSGNSGNFQDHKLSLSRPVSSRFAFCDPHLLGFLPAPSMTILEHDYRHPALVATTPILLRIGMRVVLGEDQDFTHRYLRTKVAISMLWWPRGRWRGSCRYLRGAREGGGGHGGPNGTALVRARKIKPGHRAHIAVRAPRD